MGPKCLNTSAPPWVVATLEGVCSVRNGPKSPQEERFGQLPSFSSIRAVCRAPAMENGDCESASFNLVIAVKCLAWYVGETEK